MLKGAGGDVTCAATVKLIVTEALLPALSVTTTVGSN